MMTYDHSPEVALIGSILTDPSQFRHVDGLPAECFADVNLGALWTVLVEMHEAGEPVRDMVCVTHRLKERNIDEKYRTPSALMRLTRDSVIGTVPFLAKQIRDGYCRRQMESLATELAQRAADPTITTDDTDGWLRAKLDGIGSTTPAKSISARDAGIAAADELAEFRHAVATTGIVSVDQLVGGFKAGELIVLAARPGQGKSALAMQIALNVAAHEQGVLFVSLEMTAKELMRRVLSADCHIDGRIWRNNSYTSDDVQDIRDAAEGYGDMPLRIWEPRKRSEATTARVANVAALERARFGTLGLIVVDYLQLIEPRDRRIQRHEQVGEMTSALKGLAHDVGAPVLVLAQLNRAADKTDAPQLSHLRESGSIEQDADIVLMIHNDDDESQLIVGKHRHGSTGKLSLRFNRRETRFEEAGPDRFESLDSFNEETEAPATVDHGEMCEDTSIPDDFV